MNNEHRSLVGTHGLSSIILQRTRLVYLIRLARSNLLLMKVLPLLFRFLVGWVRPGNELDRGTPTRCLFIFVSNNMQLPYKQTRNWNNCDTSYAESCGEKDELDAMQVGC